MQWLQSKLKRSEKSNVSYLNSRGKSKRNRKGSDKKIWPAIQIIKTMKILLMINNKKLITLRIVTLLRISCKIIQKILKIESNLIMNSFRTKIKRLKIRLMIAKKTQFCDKRMSNRIQPIINQVSLNKLLKIVLKRIN